MKVYTGGYRDYREVVRFSLNTTEEAEVGYSSDNNIKDGLFWAEAEGRVKGVPMVVKGLEALNEAVSTEFADALRAEFGKDKSALLVPKSKGMEIGGEDGMVTLTADTALNWMFKPVASPI